MLFYPSKMHIQFMQVLQQRAQRGAFGHLGEGLTASSLLWLGIESELSMLSLCATFKYNSALDFRSSVREDREGRVRCKMYGLFTVYPSIYAVVLEGTWKELGRRLRAKFQVSGFKFQVTQISRMARILAAAAAFSMLIAV